MKSPVNALSWKHVRASKGGAVVFLLVLFVQKLFGIYIVCVCLFGNSLPYGFSLFFQTHLNVF